MQDLDKELAGDIGYALARSPFKVKGQQTETRRLPADGVVGHLRQAGWLSNLKPPVTMHDPSTRTGPPPEEPAQHGAVEKRSGTGQALDRKDDRR
ncbi:MAG: hypothetical protein ACK5JT_05850 [Hyphomicrobiaceae bacterium]